MSEIGQNGSSQGAWTLQHDPHEEFQELCALSTTGELTEEEWARLREHLALCDECREAKRQYERLITTAVPDLAAQAQGEEEEESTAGTWSIDEAEKQLLKSLPTEPKSARIDSVSSSEPFRPKNAWRLLVAAAILSGVCLGGYELGLLHQRRSEAAVHVPGPAAPEKVPQVAPVPIPDVKQTREEDRAAEQRNEPLRSAQETARLKDQLSQLRSDLAKQSADLDKSLQDRQELGRELAQAQTSAQSLQTRLNVMGSQSSQDTVQLLGLKTQIEDLRTELGDKDKQIARDQELLQRDRDIRNLIGARNLYIAEIYDVGKSGDTEKPFGRVFYTKDKSLIFYGYDLDQHEGIKKDASFQAWGRREAKGQHDVSLGLLYLDDVNKKRWVLKFNDAKTIAQIDAVFITVEPEGGSPKPTGNPLLFTYLRLDPNHP